MSLINEALKRAKEAQEHAPPPGLSAAHLRPFEPERSAHHAAGLLLPIVLTLVALAGLFFLWRAAQENSPSTSVAPRIRPTAAMPLRPAGEPAAPAVAAVTAPTPSAAVARGAKPTATTPPSAAVASAPAGNAVLAAAPAPVVAAPATVFTPSAAANAPLVAQAAPPAPAPLRLQGIFFHPTRPWAMVNGKTVFVGDRLGEYRVLAISHDSATLGGPTRTNVLSLSE